MRAQCLLAAFAFAPLLAQSPTFEVAVIKPSAACARDNISAGRLNLGCKSLRDLIETAYGDAIDHVEGGPAWISTDRYDISAKAADAATSAQMLGPMLQTLLEDRFHLRAHTEVREVPVYALTVAKNGPRLKEPRQTLCKSEPRPGNCAAIGVTSRDSGLMAYGLGVDMRTLARFLTGYVDRKVIDKTGLTKSFDVELDFARDETLRHFKANGKTLPPPAPSDQPSIFTAVQSQLGLKLVPEKGMIDVLVIDRAEKPTEN